MRCQRGRDRAIGSVSEEIVMANKRKSYEGSPADIAEDKRGAKKLGMTAKQYERSARDKAEDKRGQAKLSKRGKWK